MSEPFDLDAAVTDTAGEPFRFTWGGESFALDPLLAMDIERQLELIDLIEHLDDNDDRLDPAKLLEIVKHVVGADLLDRMRELRPVGGAALMALLRQWMAHQGVALGKSPASADSSANTAPKSKPTSRSGQARRTS